MAARPKTDTVQWTIRTLPEVMEWLTMEAARETIRRKKRVSMNKLAVEILTKAMERAKKKGGE
jgi:hypothetical protein